MEMLTLTHQVWEEYKVSIDWCNGELILVPKKSDLKKCNNWRRIALLVKVVAHVLQERLQRLAKAELY